MKNKVNWAILGAGAVSEYFASDFPRKRKDCHLLAVADKFFAKAEDFAKRYNIERVYDDMNVMLQDPDIDIVYIGTQTGFHCEHIKACLNAGKHVLAEKTIVMNLQQLEECMALAKEKGLILAEALTSIYEPVMAYMKKKIDAGDYGKLHFVTVTCGSGKEYDPKNRFFNPALGGGALFDIGCYAIGFANYFMHQAPTSIQSTGVLCDTGVDLKSGYVLRNDLDEIATVMIALRSKTEKIGIIACENAFIRIEQFIRAHKATVCYPDGRYEEYEFTQPTGAFDYEVIALTEDILAGKKDCTVCPIDFTHSILTVMDEARRQWDYKFDFEEEIGVCKKC